jgi:hypothetical protein
MKAIFVKMLNAESSGYFLPELNCQENSNTEVKDCKIGPGELLSMYCTARKTFYQDVEVYPLHLILLI